VLYYTRQDESTVHIPSRLLTLY